ncbi:MAG: hypothetical protein KatS3mg105_3447 [Gemmatales bacterium]|nr:MAG: hypothetical protein KatS3mg105_3447 [Gemmatales bacterium]
MKPRSQQKVSQNFLNDVISRRSVVRERQAPSWRQMLAFTALHRYHGQENQVFEEDMANTETKYRWYQRIGPGLITACVVIGPGSILTSSNVGAANGFAMSWVVVAAVVFMLTFTTLGAKLGVVAAESPGDLVAGRAGRWLAALIGFGVFFISAAFQFGNNLGVDSAFAVYWRFDYTVVFFNLLAIGFLYFFRNLYQAVERLMMIFVGLMLLSFAANLAFAFAKRPAFGEFLRGFIPPIGELVSREPDLSLLGLVGTTFVITAAYYQAYLVKQKGWTEADLEDGLVDARVGAVIMALITLMIMSTSGAVFYNGTLQQLLKDVKVAGGHFVLQQDKVFVRLPGNEPLPENLAHSLQSQQKKLYDYMTRWSAADLAKKAPISDREFIEFIKEAKKAKVQFELHGSQIVAAGEKVTERLNRETAVHQGTLRSLMSQASSDEIAAKTRLKDVKDVARQLEPLFGPAGQALFCLGLFSAAYSSFLVNSMIGGFILADGLGLGSRPTDRWPKLLTTLALLTGMGVALLVIKAGVNPVPAIVAAQAVTVIASPLMAGTLLWLTNRRDIMGERKNGILANVLGTCGFLLLLVMAWHLATEGIPRRIREFRAESAAVQPHQNHVQQQARQ